MYELVINHGHLIDPASGVSSRLHLGVRQGKVATVSAEPLRGEQEIDATGLYITPGFIDLHVHEDIYDPKADHFALCASEALLSMGVTTAVGGNCGIGSGMIDGDPVAVLDAVDRIGYPVNLALHAPHECLRKSFGDFDRNLPVPAANVEQMKARLADQLQGGCIGLSLGLEYIPGVDSFEVTELMQVVADRGRLVAAHIRSDADQAIPAVQEMLDYSRLTGARLQISHLSSMASFGQMEEALSLIDEARLNGLDVGFDSYPYYAFCTGLGTAVFDDGFLRRFGLGDEGYQRLQMTYGELAGQRFLSEQQFVEQRRKYPEALIIAYLLQDQEVDRSILHPSGIVGSDGIYVAGKGHPRGSGTFPRLIREYVLERKLLSLEEAVAKATKLPAERLGLNHKGTLRPGADADITIIDLNKLRDCASYTDPLLPPEGIVHVLLGGKSALHHGRIVNASLGRSVRNR